LARARHSPYNSRLLHSGAYSSVGQSSRLIIDWSQVQVLLGPPFPSVMSDLIGLFQPEITDFGRSSGAKLRFTKPRLHPAGPTIPFGHVGPHWTNPAAQSCASRNPAGILLDSPSPLVNGSHLQTQRTATAAPSMRCCAAACLGFQAISSTSTMPPRRQTQPRWREAGESRRRPASRGMRAAMV